MQSILSDKIILCKGAAGLFMAYGYKRFCAMISLGLGGVRILLLCIIAYYQQPAAALEIIANIDDAGQIKNANDLRAIFSLRTRYWDNGEKIRVFVLPDDNAVHKVFVKEKLGMFPHQLRRTWNRMTYTGTGQPPVTVNSVTEMIEKIKSTKNSIGYIGGRIEDEAIQVFDTP